MSLRKRFSDKHGNKAIVLSINYPIASELAQYIARIHGRTTKCFTSKLEELFRIHNINMRQSQHTPTISSIMDEEKQNKNF